MPKRYLKGPSPLREVKDLLASLLVSELLNPGKRVWLSSPWISDVVVIDNSFREFQGLIPDQASVWLLSTVLNRLAERGSTVRIMTREPNESRPGTVQLVRNLDDTGSVQLKYSEELHEKGLLTERFYLEGSMNFTYNGLNINREAVTLETSADEVAKQHLEFEAYWKSL